MKISADCPYLDPRREIPPGESHTIQCCRPEAPYHDDCEPICCKMPDEIEAYRLHWDSAFRGHAIIRVGRFEDGGLVLRYLYRYRLFPEARRGRLALALAEWTILPD